MWKEIRATLTAVTEELGIELPVDLGAVTDGLTGAADGLTETVSGVAEAAGSVPEAVGDAVADVVPGATHPAQDA